MAWMPGASRAQTFNGNRHRRRVTKIVLHTTEGSSWPGYGGGGYAPHFTVKPGKPSSKTIRQHIDTEESSKALENDRGGVETNNAGVIQIEFIGSCDRSYAKKHDLFFTETAKDDDLLALAAVVAWIAAEHDIPLTVGDLDWPTSNAAYESAPQRFSGSQWYAYRGICGHTHVPENAHWDPGNFPVGRLLRLAGGEAPSMDPWDLSPRISGMGETEVREIQRLLDSLGYDLGSYGVDGSYGEDTYNAVKEFQKDSGIVVDGVAGPVTLATLRGAKKESASPVPSVPSGGMSVPVPRPAKRDKIDEDGRFGRKTVRAFQGWLNREHNAGLDVDGKAGRKTWRALQDALDAPYKDGKISRQSYRAEELGNGITQGWEYTGPNSEGSQTVELLQRLVGVDDDGIWFEGTTTALQRWLNKR